jgi:hypothetical protein
MRHLLVVLLLLAGSLSQAQVLPEAQRGEGGIHRDAVLRPTLALADVPRPDVVAGELTTKRFRILYTQRAQGAAQALAAQIEGVRDAFGGVLGRDWPGTTEIRLGVGRKEFEALALPGGAPPGWAVALAYPVHQIVLLDALSLNAPDGPVTLRHELAHVALGQLAPVWPRWFQEGLAQNLTGERYSVTHYSALFRAVTQERVFHFEDLAEEWPDLPADVEIAYAQSAAFVAHLTEHYGPQTMGRLVDGVRAGEPFEMAFGKAFRTSLLVEENAWREELANRYGWLPLTTSTALVWLVGSGLCVAAYLRRRHQKGKKLEALAAEDAAEDAALRVLAAEAEQRGTPADPNVLLPEWAEPLPPASPPAPEGADDDDPSRPDKPTLH